MPTTRTVFISYSTREESIAMQLTNALKKSGFRTWISKYGLEGGDDWHQKIDKILRSSGVVIVLWSMDAMVSEWVKHEASQAMAKEAYLPVRIQLIDIINPFNRSQAIDLYNWDRDKNCSIYWDGDVTHPGYVNLENKLKKLLPSHQRRVLDFIWLRGAIIILAIITLFALVLLSQQRTALKSQIDSLSMISKEVHKQGMTINRQLKIQDIMAGNVRGQSNKLDTQLIQLAKMSSTITKQNARLQSNLTQQNKITQQKQDALTYPLNLLTIGINYHKRLTLRDYNSLQVELFFFTKSNFNNNPDLYKVKNDNLWSGLDKSGSLDISGLKIDELGTKQGNRNYKREVSIIKKKFSLKYDSKIFIFRQSVDSSNIRDLPETDIIKIVDPFNYNKVAQLKSLRLQGLRDLVNTVLVIRIKSLLVKDIPPFSLVSLNAGSQYYFLVGQVYTYDNHLIFVGYIDRKKYEEVFLANEKN